MFYALLGKRNGLSYEETCDRLKRQYDGYRFTGWEVEGIYNPYSLLNALNNREFGNYWFLTATPTMLIDLLKEKDIRLSQLDGTERSENDLLGLDKGYIDPIVPLFQCGLLTIKGCEERGFTKYYRLGVPNEEVADGISLLNLAR